jgi:S1-C subfamily serine protease
LRPGDIIYALDGKPVPDAGTLQAEMLTRRPGQTVLVDVLRTNTPMRFQVTTWAWPGQK